MGQKEYYEYDVESNQIHEIEELPDRKGKPIFAKMPKIDKWKLFKMVTCSVASGCASIVMGKYLKSAMPEANGMVDKAIMDIGMYCITGAVGTLVSKNIDRELDELKANLETSVQTDISKEE